MCAAWRRLAPCSTSRAGSRTRWRAADNSPSCASASASSCQWPDRARSWRTPETRSGARLSRAPIVVLRPDRPADPSPTNRESKTQSTTGSDIDKVHEVAPSVDEWAERIRPHLDRAAESFVAAGRELTAAKAALPHGGFLELVASLDLAPRTAQRLMQIAHHPVFSDATRGSHLPNAWRTLAELARVPEDDLLAAIE